MLRIDSLKLRNFKNVESADFTFGNGMFLINGANGEGKSTVFHAVLLLLFDSTVSNLGDYVRWGEDSFETGCDFTYNDHPWHMEFDYGKRGGTRTLTDKSTGESWTNKGALEKLSTLYDVERARASIVSLEGEANIVSVTPAKRREYLKGVYDLGFKTQLAKVQTDIDSIGREKTALEGKVATLESQTFVRETLERMPYPESEYHVLQDSLKAQESNLASAQERARMKKQLYNEIVSIESDIRTYRDDIARIENRIAQAESQKAEMEKNLADNAQKAEKEKKQVVEGLNNRKQSLSDTLAKSQIELDIKKKAMSALTAPVEPDAHKRIEAGKKVAEESMKLSMYKKQLAPLSNGVCPTCGQKVGSEILDGLNKQIAESEKALAYAQNEERKAEEEYTAWYKANSQYQSQKNELFNAINSLSSQVSNLSVSLANSDSEMQREIAKIESRSHERAMRYSATVSSCKATIESETERKKTTETTIAKSQDSLKAKKEEYVQMADVDVSSIEDSINHTSERIALYESVAKRNDTKRAVNERLARQEKERDDALIKAKKELADKTEMLNHLVLAKRILSKEFPSYVISRMVQTLRMYINEFLSKVYPKYEVNIEETSDALRITFGDNDADVKMASGFEKASFSLAYMYAFGRLQNFGMLMIDEGDAQSSEENSMKFYSTLGKAKDYFPQILAITHKNDVKEFLKGDCHASVYTAENGTYTFES